MVKQLETPIHSEIVYPDSDGQPTADNTVQFRWIMVIYHNLAWLFAENPEVFVAGDLLWYPVQGDSSRQAPDIMVAFGVPKGDRGSYKQWKENNIAPQVVFEILSPGNTLKEMSKKLVFYDNHGVEEYYLYDPQKNDLTGWLRSGSLLDVIDEMNGWVSPRLGIKFEVLPEILQLYRPDGQSFADYFQIQQQLNEERQAKEEERQAREVAESALQQERQAKEEERQAREVAESALQQERQAKEVAEERTKRLEQLLREAGIDTDC
ncbi:Uma2 family endonuclease [Okeania sp. SIO1I7]|uniref:Uma2 family endonuclease n=1 Tax=Okeania sp. SIO1I7 TaxID=2607772 RepID=UPI0013FC3473|nr:Uma2 family endonuclease [Okeania sp. SIO1I7]NET24665.1 Uma2 family endonuclease [Okeania sp. SIO1I7]